MRIGLVTACYKPVVNGVTRMVSLYKAELAARGHEVTVFTLGEPDPAGEEPEVVRSPAIPVGNTGYYVTPRFTREAQARLGEMEIIHCHHLFMSVEMAHRYGRCPIVYTNHTRYDLYTGAYMPIPQPAADAIMRQVWPEVTDLADVVITPSASVQQIMLAFGVRRPIVTIENGVDLRPYRRLPAPCSRAALGAAETAVLLMYVGRLAPEKNLPVLLDQVAAALEAVPNLHLCLVGDGALQVDLRLQAAALGIGERVTFCGAVPVAQVPGYLAAADLFVTASQSEVHPLTIIEALASGLPVVAPAAPGIVDCVASGETGLLVQRPDRSLAAALAALAVDPARRRAMGEAARAASARYDIERTVSKTLALYDWLRARRPDLRRDKEHGRWNRSRERLQPLLEQLSSLLRPPEKERG